MPQDLTLDSIRVRVLTVTLFGSSALAWLALWRLGASPSSRFGHEHLHAAAAQGGGATLVPYLVGWVLMLVAMMLPTSVPLVALFFRIARDRRDHWLLVSLVIAGYLGTWTAAGVVGYLAAQALLPLIHMSEWAHAHTQWLAAATLVLAGVFQFTPLKYRCLEKCRSPFSFIAEHWRGSAKQWHALALGAHHGLYCIGCCWSLMLLMFTVGSGSIGWMLLLGTLMAIEKNSRWGKPFGVALGFSLVIAGVSFAFWPA